MNVTVRVTPARDCRLIAHPDVKEGLLLRAPLG